MYLARFVSPWETTYLNRHQTYSECVQEMVNTLKETPLAEISELEVSIIKGNLDSENPKDYIVEKIDLTAWIEYKRNH